MRRNLFVHSFIDECSIIDLHSDIRELAITIRKNKRLKVPDAIIAATSKHSGFPLVTLDSDFEILNDFDVILLEN